MPPTRPCRTTNHIVKKTYQRQLRITNGGLVEVKRSSVESLLGEKATLESVVGSECLSRVADFETFRTGLVMQAPSGESAFKGTKVVLVEVAE